MYYSNILYVEFEYITRIRAVLVMLLIVCWTTKKNVRLIMYTHVMRKYMNRRTE